MGTATAKKKIIAYHAPDAQLARHAGHKDMLAMEGPPQSIRLKEAPHSLIYLSVHRACTCHQNQCSNDIAPGPTPTPRAHRV